jgi:hypothetical protein
MNSIAKSCRVSLRARLRPARTLRVFSVTLAGAPGAEADDPIGGFPDPPLQNGTRAQDELWQPARSHSQRIQ